MPSLHQYLEATQTPRLTTGQLAELQTAISLEGNLPPKVKATLHISLTTQGQQSPSSTEQSAQFLRHHRAMDRKAYHD